MFFYRRGMLFYAKQDYGRALPISLRRSGSNPTYVDACWNRGEANAVTAKRNAAPLRTTLKSSGSEPDARAAYFARGQIYQSEGHHDLAIADSSAFVRSTRTDLRRFPAARQFASGEGRHRSRHRGLRRGDKNASRICRLRITNAASPIGLKATASHAIADFRQVVRISTLPPPDRCSCIARRRAREDGAGRVQLGVLELPK